MITSNFKLGKYTETVWGPNTMWFAPASKKECLRPACKCKDTFNTIWNIMNSYAFDMSFSNYHYLFDDSLKKTECIVLYRGDLILQKNESNIQMMMLYLNEYLGTNLTVHFEKEKAVVTLCRKAKQIQPALVSYMFLCFRVAPFYTGGGVRTWMKDKFGEYVKQNDINQLKSIERTIKLIENKKLPYTWSSRFGISSVKDFLDRQNEGVEHFQDINYAFFTTGPFQKIMTPRGTRRYFSYYSKHNKEARAFGTCKSYIQDNLAKLHKEKVIRDDYYLLTYKILSNQGNIERILGPEMLNADVEIDTLLDFTSIKLSDEIKRTPYLVSLVSGLLRVSELLKEEDPDLISFVKRINNTKAPGLGSEASYLNRCLPLIKLILNKKRPEETWETIKEHCGPHGAGYFSTTKRLNLLDV